MEPVRAKIWWWNYARVWWWKRLLMYVRAFWTGADLHQVEHQHITIIVNLNGKEVARYELQADSLKSVGDWAGSEVDAWGPNAVYTINQDVELTF